LVTAPTFGIGNSIAFRNLRDPDADFGRVRMWGTIGWMLIGWGVTAVMLYSGSTRSGRGAYETFWIGAGFSAILSVFALTLPNTPPLAVSGRVSTLGSARELLRQPGVRAYLLIAFAVHMTTPFVFQTMPPYLESIGMPRAWAATVLTIGQWPEIAALAGLPWLLRRYGYKITLGVGIVAWLIRFGTLAADPPLWLAVAGIPLHGIGIACFTVGGQVFLDSRASSDRRAGAQALNMMTTSGLGSFAGSLMAGNLIGYCEGNYAVVFLVPCLIHVGLIGLFIMGFHPDGGVASRLVDAVPSPARPVPRDRSRRIVAGVGPLAMESADG